MISRVPLLLPLLEAAFRPRRYKAASAPKLRPRQRGQVGGIGSLAQASARPWSDPYRDPFRQFGWGAYRRGDKGVLGQLKKGDDDKDKKKKDDKAEYAELVKQLGGRAAQAIQRLRYSRVVPGRLG